MCCEKAFILNRGPYLIGLKASVLGSSSGKEHVTEHFGGPGDLAGRRGHDWEWNAGVCVRWRVWGVSSEATWSNSGRGKKTV